MSCAAQSTTLKDAHCDSVRPHAAKNTSNKNTFPVVWHSRYKNSEPLGDVGDTAAKGDAVGSRGGGPLDADRRGDTVGAGSGSSMPRRSPRKALLDSTLSSRLPGRAP